MSQQNNYKEKNITAIILCAGKGTRFGNLTQEIPKPLIKIDSLNNISILFYLINHLQKFDIQKIGIVTGYLHEKIESFFRKVKAKYQNLQNKIIFSHSGEQYKKGPLYSLFSIISNKSLYLKNNLLIVFPGDTIFEYKLLKEVFKLIKLNYDFLLEEPGVFFQKIKVQDLLHNYNSVSVIESKNRIEQISTIDLKIIPKKSYINLVIPILVLNKKTLEIFFRLSEINPVKQIKEVLNIYIMEKQKIQYFKINSKRRFYDIDTLTQLKNFNLSKKKGGQ